MKRIIRPVLAIVVVINIRLDNQRVVIARGRRIPIPVGAANNLTTVDKLPNTTLGGLMFRYLVVRGGLAVDTNEIICTNCVNRLIRENQLRRLTCNRRQGRVRLRIRTRKMHVGDKFDAERRGCRRNSFRRHAKGRIRIDQCPQRRNYRSNWIRRIKICLRHRVGKGRAANLDRIGIANRVGVILHRWNDNVRQLRGAGCRIRYRVNRRLRNLNAVHLNGSAERCLTVARHNKINAGRRR